MEIDVTGDLISHAHHLIDWQGECNDGNCDSCVYTFYSVEDDTYMECTPRRAFNAAERFLAEHGNFGRCKSIW